MIAENGRQKQRRRPGRESCKGMSDCADPAFGRVHKKKKRWILRFNAWSLVRSRELESRALWLKAPTRHYWSMLQLAVPRSFLSKFRLFFNIHSASSSKFCICCQPLYRLKPCKFRAETVQRDFRNLEAIHTQMTWRHCFGWSQN